MPVDSDRDVFARFQNEGQPPGIALLAFARYAEAKYDWEAHYQDRFGRPPDAPEIEDWIQNLPDSRLSAILAEAVAYFGELAAAYMEPRIAAERQKAIDSSIVGDVQGMVAQVKKAMSFWSTFWANVAAGIVASFVFALLIVFAALIFNKDPSPFSFLRQPQPAATPASTPAPSLPARPAVP